MLFSIFFQTEEDLNGHGILQSIQREFHPVMVIAFFFKNIVMVGNWFNSSCPCFT